jgi:predicted nucleic acid-binding protein
VTVVIDSSALVAYCLKEKACDAGKISEILRNGAISPNIIVTETANAILIASRRGLVDLDTAKKALNSALQVTSINLRMISQSELVSDAYDLAAETRLTVYDALFVFLAKKTKSSLASVDEGQLRAATNLGIKQIELRI